MENSFLPKLEENGPTNRVFYSHFLLPKNNTKSPSQTPSQNSCSGVIAQIFLTSQVAGFFKKIEGSS